CANHTAERRAVESPVVRVAVSQKGRSTIAEVLIEAAIGFVSVIAERHVAHVVIREPRQVRRRNESGNVCGRRVDHILGNHIAREWRAVCPGCQSSAWIVEGETRNGGKVSSDGIGLRNSS